MIITNFHLYLIQLWWQFFQIFVYGDVVYAQSLEVLTLKELYRATLRKDVSKFRPEVYKSEKWKILKQTHKVALGKLLT